MPQLVLSSCILDVRQRRLKTVPVRLLPSNSRFAILTTSTSPVPKFLCVKGILFFSFWQSVGISTLVAAKVITRLGPYTDPENVSVGLNDLLICMEMPFFAFAHMYAFAYTDFIDPTHTFVARMPMYYAFRDAFGPLDVIEDSKATLRGEGMDTASSNPQRELCTRVRGATGASARAFATAKADSVSTGFPRPRTRHSLRGARRA